jgi:hypothetical protein
VPLIEGASYCGNKYCCLRAVALNQIACGSVLGGADLNTWRSQIDRPRVTEIHSRDTGSPPSPEPLRLDECRLLTPASPFDAMVRETAHALAVEPRALAVRALLHLPRLATYTGRITRRQVQRQLRISADQLRRDVRAAARHVPSERFLLSELSFEEIDSSRADPVLTSLHYLKSVRPGSIYFALVDPIDRLPVSLCSVSPLEWKCVASRLGSQFHILPERAWDITRVYSVHNAPRNAISTLLSRVRLRLRHSQRNVELLLTAVDPNLGFAGGSYRAANWQQWMTVRARPYLYEYGRYISPRQLRERFGTSSLPELQAKYPGRFQQSRARLLDSMIYCCKVNGETKAVLAEDMPRLHR